METPQRVCDLTSFLHTESMLISTERDRKEIFKFSSINFLLISYNSVNLLYNSTLKYSIITYSFGYEQSVTLKVYH